MKLKLIIVLLIVSLCSCIVTNAPSNTDRTKIKILDSKNKITQKLITPYDDFMGIVILYKPIISNTGINVKIFKQPENKSVFEKKFILNPVDAKYKTLKILFPVIINNSRNNEYLLEITSDKKIKIFGGKETIYHKAIYKIKLSTVVKQFLKKFYSDKLFFYFYIFLILFIIALIIFVK